MSRVFTVDMPDGSVWGVPAEVIADNYAKFYAEKGEDYQENYDTMLQWFDDDDYDFHDWAKDNMDWDDVKDKAFLVTPPKPCDYQEGWINGESHCRHMNTAKTTNAASPAVDMEEPKDDVVNLFTIDFPDGSIYGVRTEVIADNYAKRCALDGGNYEKSFNHMLDKFHDKGNIDFYVFAKREMKWDDVKDKAVMIRTPDKVIDRIDYQECWRNCASTHLLMKRHLWEECKKDYGEGETLQCAQ